MITVKKFGLKIYNLKEDKVPLRDVAYVGRPTTFGNPYSHLKGAGIHKVRTAKEAVEKFREYCERNRAIAEQARKYLRGKHLACWCVPEECHATVLMELANESERRK